MKKDIFAGVFLGLLIGFIVGLSISQVTGIILGALTSLLAAFFGLKGNKEGESGNQIIIGSFSLSCLITIFLGIYIRTHNILAPSLQEELKTYKELKFSPEEIKKIVLMEKLGLVPKDFEFNPDAKNKSTQGVLHAGESETPFLCNAIEDSSTLEDIRSAYIVSGWKYQQLEEELSDIISNEDDLKKTLLLLKNIICQD